ncbi:hypothetical protein SADUNF_Sadunf14G0024900 [Salix dunnii]|uniref:Uncharacterized protein n=1 Tax=Salix dunnii TaxID=1413687 RepID=A0A835JCG6_9ROSI|nr:hypothetical protein SADUNF_Sadunf14G0024900 [Salix dunnii]
MIGSTAELGGVKGCASTLASNSRARIQDSELRRAVSIKIRFVPIVNSTRLTGGAPPPIQFRVPPQSPVMHLPLPDSSNMHPVLAQNRPDQPGGAWNWTDAPGTNVKPPSPRAAAPFPERVPGHKV